MDGLHQQAVVLEQQNLEVHQGFAHVEVMIRERCNAVKLFWLSEIHELVH